MGKVLGLLRIRVLLTFGMVGFHGGARGRVGLWPTVRYNHMRLPKGWSGGPQAHSTEWTSE